MLLDIYMRTPIVRATREHVIMNALGGRLEVLDLIDQRTNSTFGDSIDAALATDLLLPRVLLNAEAADGRPPPLFKGAKTPEGKGYNLGPGGKPERAKPGLRVQKSEERLTITGHVRNLSELRRLAGPTLARHGVSQDVLVQAWNPERTYAPQLQLPLNLQIESFRSIAKTACNLFATTARDIFMFRAFDGVRSFVADGGHRRRFTSLRADAIDLNASSPIGALDHLVVVRSDERTGEVTGLVVFFGHLQFVVRLGRMPVGVPFAASYRVNQLSQEDRKDAPVDMAVGVPPLVTSEPETPESEELTFTTAMAKIIRVGEEHSFAFAVNETIEDAIEEVLGRHTLSEPRMDQRIAIGELVATRYGDMVQRSGRRLPAAEEQAMGDKVAQRLLDRGNRGRVT